MAKKILIIEDDVQIARFVELELEHEGYQVKKFDNGYDGIHLLRNESYDLLLLDLMLPGMDGIEVCRRVREFSDLPIIMLTAKSELDDKVEGLDTGADDYLTKPFEIEELLARIRALLRREEGKVESDNVLKTADVEVNLDAHLVKRAAEKIELTKKEYDLLVYLIQNEGIVVSRDKLLNNVWGYDYTGETNIVDVYIRYLRSKIDDPFEEKIIQTVRGVGYVLRTTEDA
ncbi:response regulator transcription factor [Halanaerobium salsuginis]|jgi:DNA-binding response OmpR family regulator|uniref:Stage 0 sporulation protein A homolog n=1 Tax=Halanaerobium salsuginis TaxID=29563 RepID=A0A1I4H012_9FIRM|nr:response regulator transcription factor [Halanaerobium salsuginis]SFL35638.1 DNA-binding response regulator, OmpR family, contains REC and winged-helix (wHTH) domain [Halanaerobium salsuginis]